MSQIGVSNTVIHCRFSYIESYKEIETLTQRHIPPVVRSSEVFLSMCCGGNQTKCCENRQVRCAFSIQTEDWFFWERRSNSLHHKVRMQFKRHLYISAQDWTLGTISTRKNIDWRSSKSPSASIRCRVFSVLQNTSLILVTGAICIVKCIYLKNIRCSKMSNQKKNAKFLAWKLKPVFIEITHSIGRALGKLMLSTLE